jgi:TolB-like protein
VIEDRPSVAVLPFQDLSHDPLASGILADGMTEEVTNALARLPGFFVTARQSALAYRGLGMDVRRIAGELGVRYLVEGSVEQDGRRMRANLRLIDGRTGLTLWADGQGGPMRDLLAMRDAVVHCIATRLQPRLMLAEMERAMRSPPPEFDAWTWLQRANGMLLPGRNRLSLEQVLDPLQRALAVDPQYGMAHAMLAAVYTWRVVSLLSPDVGAERQLARQHAEAALAAEPDNPQVLVYCAEVAIYASADIDRGLAMVTQAVERNPNDAHGLALQGHLRRFAGEDPKASLALIDGALRISPRDPRTFSWHHYANWCHWRLGELDRMEAASRRSIELYGQYSMSWIALTSALALQERLAEGREAAAVLRRQRPGFTPDGFFEVSRHVYGRRFRGAVEREYDQLRKALNRIW